jgi:hypothetical protein
MYPYKTEQKNEDVDHQTDLINFCNKIPTFAWTGSDFSLLITIEESVSNFAFLDSISLRNFEIRTLKIDVKNITRVKKIENRFMTSESLFLAQRAYHYQACISAFLSFFRFFVRSR